MTKHAALLFLLQAPQCTAEKTAALRALTRAAGEVTRGGLSAARTMTHNALTAGKALIGKVAPAPAPVALSPLGTPWPALQGRSFREIHNSLLGQTMGSRAVPARFPSAAQAAKYRAAIGTPRELGRENAYLSATMDPADARHIALKAKGIYARAQAPVKTSAAHSTKPELKQDYTTMTKHAALLSMLKVAAAQEVYHVDTRRAGILCVLKTAAAQEGIKKAALAGLLRGASNVPWGSLGKVVAASARVAPKAQRGTSAIRGMPKAPSALAQAGSGVMQALRRPGAVLAGAGAGAYGLSKMSSADLALMKVAARIINADVGLDAIIAHIKAAKARRVVAA